jgi:hypothetical protein
MFQSPQGAETSQSMQALSELLQSSDLLAELSTSVSFDLTTTLQENFFGFLELFEQVFISNSPPSVILQHYYFRPSKHTEELHIMM